MFVDRAAVVHISSNVRIAHPVGIEYRPRRSNKLWKSNSRKGTDSHSHGCSENFVNLINSHVMRTHHTFQKRKKCRHASDDHRHRHQRLRRCGNIWHLLLYSCACAKKAFFFTHLSTLVAFHCVVCVSFPYESHSDGRKHRWAVVEIVIRNSVCRVLARWYDIVCVCVYGCVLVRPRIITMH